jgi:hypothetical protein
MSNLETTVAVLVERVNTLLEKIDGNVPNKCIKHEEQFNSVSDSIARIWWAIGILSTLFLAAIAVVKIIG